MTLVIAHRGASGHRPEHTAAAYRLAAAQGADALEVDLVPTRDGVLVARHESELSATTDVAERRELGHLRTTRDGVTGWFAEDLTLAEIGLLRARERLPHLRPASARHDGREGVLTLEDVLDLSRRLGREPGRPLPLQLEMKRPSRRPRVVARALRAALGTRPVPVRLLSFDSTWVAGAARSLGLPVHQSVGVDQEDLVRPDRLDALGPHVVGLTVDRRLLRARPELVGAAAERGLRVDVFTYDGDVPGDLADAAEDAAMGIGGLIGDHPAELRTALFRSRIGDRDDRPPGGDRSLEAREDHLHVPQPLLV